MADVRLSDRALASLLRHEAWLRARNPVAADRLRSDVDRALRLLGDNPEMGPRVVGARSRSKVTRRYRYRLIYSVQADEVLILDVLHPSQSDPP